MTKQTDEIAELKARIEQLERANKPPEPFVPKPYEPIDWTAHVDARLSAAGDGRGCSGSLD